MSHHIPLKYRARLWLKRQARRVSPGTRLLFCLALSNALAPGYMRFRVLLWVIDLSALASYVADRLPRSPF